MDTQNSERTVTTAVERRTARRMLHRSRSVAVSMALTLAAAVAVLALVETIRAAQELSPMLISAAQVRAALVDGGMTGALTAGVAGALGIALLWAALAPGRTGRRLIDTHRAPVVVDDTIVAGALSRGAAGGAAVASSQVDTRISRRRADVSITPSSGFAVPAADIERSERAAVDALGLTPTVTVRVRVNSRGVLA